MVYSIFKVGLVQQMAPSVVQQAKNFSGARKIMDKGDSVYGDQANRDQQVVKKRGEYQGQKVGRNDPCPCGSGKKFKKCHGA